MRYRRVTALLPDGHGETIIPKRVARLRRRDGLLAPLKETKRRGVKPCKRVRRHATRWDEICSYDFI